MHESRFVLTTCTDQSNAAWHLLIRPTKVKKKYHDCSRKCLTAILIKPAICYLFKLLLDVCVCLQLELSARVWSVYQKEPLLGVHLLDQYGSFFVVPCLKNKTKQKYNVPFTDFIIIK